MFIRIKPNEKLRVAHSRGPDLLWHSGYCWERISSSTVLLCSVARNITPCTRHACSLLLVAVDRDFSDWGYTHTHTHRHTHTKKLGSECALILLPPSDRSILLQHYITVWLTHFVCQPLHQLSSQMGSARVNRLC